MSVLSYNILADGLANSYHYLAMEHVDIEYRARLVMDTVTQADADVICL